MIREVAHILVRANDEDIVAYNADLADNRCKCDDCGEEFFTDLVVVTDKRRWYIKVDDGHVHLMKGGEVQI